MTKKSTNSVQDASIPQDVSRRTADRPVPWLVSAVGVGIEGVALCVMAALVLWTLVDGSASTTARATTEGIALLLLAVGVLVLAANLLRRKALAKTPTLLWNVMLVPVGWNLYQGGAKALGVATIAVAVVTIVAALGIPRYELEDEPGAE